MPAQDTKLQRICFEPARAQYERGNFEAAVDKFRSELAVEIADFAHKLSLVHFELFSCATIWCDVLSIKLFALLDQINNHMKI